MSMESKVVTTITTELAKQIVSQLRSNASSMENMSTFSGLPSAVLFYPKEDLDGSLHYMYFPTAASQEFHYHPSARYLIIIGDVDTFLYHNGISINDNPYDNFEMYTIKKNTVTAIRFPAHYWHRFETKSSADEEGVIAFSFHGVDDMSSITSHHLMNMMEELTVFWKASEQ